MSICRSGDGCATGFEINLHLLEAFAEKLFNVLVPVRKLAEHLASNLATSSSGKAMTRATIRRAMSSVVGRNGRSSTRERSGISVGPMRLAWRVDVFQSSHESRLHGRIASIDSVLVTPPTVP